MLKLSVADRKIAALAKGWAPLTPYPFLQEKTFDRTDVKINRRKLRERRNRI